MKITVLFFGPAAEITGTTSEILTGVGSSESIRSFLLDRYPGLRAVSFTLAVNKRIVHTDTPLVSGDILAVLPPFSGG